MSYTAKHFVKIAGRMYTPGEIIDNPIPDDKLQAYSGEQHCRGTQRCA